MAWLTPLLLLVGLSFAQGNFLRGHKPDRCPRDTGGSCYVLGCSEWRNAKCHQGRCVCKEDECSVNGQCLPKSDWTLPDPSAPPQRRHSEEAAAVAKENFTALVLSGGGAKGAYELGVLEGICKNSSLHKYRNWSMIVGTSIGALNAGFLAQYPPHEQCTQAVEAAREFWATIKDTEDVWVSSKMADFEATSIAESREPCLTGIRAMSMALAFYRRGGLCDPTPGRQAFEFAVNKKRIEESRTMLRVVATSLSDGQPKWWTEEDEDIIDGCEASGAIAPLVYPKEIDGIGYIDGGFVANTPIMKALEEGATRVLVVELSPMSNASFIPNLDELEREDEDVGLRLIDFELALAQQRYFLEHELQMACTRYPDREIMAYLPRQNLGSLMDFSMKSLETMRLEGMETVRTQELRDLCKEFKLNDLLAEPSPSDEHDAEFKVAEGILNLKSDSTIHQAHHNFLAFLRSLYNEFVEKQVDVFFFQSNAILLGLIATILGLNAFLLGRDALRSMRKCLGPACQALYNKIPSCCCGLRRIYKAYRDVDDLGYFAMKV